MPPMRVSKSRGASRSSGLLAPPSSSSLRPKTASSSTASLLMRVPQPLLQSKARGVSPYRPVSDLEPWIEGSPEAAAEAKAALRHASLVERSTTGNTQSSLRLLIAEMMLGMQTEFTVSPQLSGLSRSTLPSMQGGGGGSGLSRSPPGKGLLGVSQSAA